MTAHLTTIAAFEYCFCFLSFSASQTQRSCRWIHSRMAPIRRSTWNDTRTYLHTDFVGLFVGLLENEIHHLANLIGSRHGSIYIFFYLTQSATHAMMALILLLPRCRDARERPIGKRQSAAGQSFGDGVLSERTPRVRSSTLECD
jgi:hypothetical protein